jgi:predicted secreted protein
MGIVSGLAVFFMIWWTTLFICLPLGREYKGVNPKGSMPGAPTKTNLKRVVIVNTIITVILWLAMYWLIDSDLISFQRLAREMV